VAEHVIRWLSCDFPGCDQRFEPDQYRALLRTGGMRTFRSIRDGAAVIGWDHTEEGDDLCKRHADAHRGATVQPELFPVSGVGDDV
jgi:hypothetical protein